MQVPSLSELFPLNEVADRIKHLRGRRINFATVYRWAICGLKVADGQRVKLQTWKIGASLATCEAALVEFFERLKPQSSDPAPAPRTPGQRERAAERAGKQLEKVGV